MTIDIRREIDQLTDEGLLRNLRTQPAGGGKFERNGQLILNFSSNDYLNLAGDPRLKEAAICAIEKYGCSSAASRLMSGNLELYDELETALADLMKTESALVFGSGFLTNLGVISALAGRDDAIFADRLNHASLNDGARISGARLHRYRHGDAAHLDELLTANEKARRRIVISDSVFSMDGDLAPLTEIAEIAKRHEALLIIDEAHAIGILGDAGSGLCALLPDSLRPDLVIATLGKSLGSYGGFVACSHEMKQFLINRARSFIYSTALPPSVLAAALKAVGILKSQPDLGLRLLDRTRLFQQLLAKENPKSSAAPHSPIVPLMIGDNHKVLCLMEKLMENNLLAVAVRPPTVPAGTARLRLSVTLAHEEADLVQAARLIGETLEKMDS